MKKLYTLFLFAMILQIGTAQITQVLDINDGTGNSSPNNLFVFGSTIYFGADDSSGINSPGGVDLGRELWSTDGTTAGTSFISDLNSGDSNSSPGNFFEYNGTLYFSANSGGGNVLFTSDGTDAGTAATGDGFIFNPTLLDGLIYFVDTTTGNSLNEFNGTTTALVAGSGSENLVGAALVAFQDKIFCYMDEATDVATIGRELYAYDPATDAFSLIKDITGDDGNSGISNFTVLGTDLFFEATGALWKTDGTTGGTIAVTAAETAAIGGLNNLFAWNGKLYFEGDNGSDDQLWAYDPAADTVTNISNITGGTGSNANNHDPSDFAALGSFLYYSGEIADDSSSYLFRTDGSTIERLDSNITDIDDIVVLNGILYFEGDDGTTGNELYEFDPATLSIERVAFSNLTIYPNPSKNQIIVDGDFSNTVTYTISDINGRQILKGELINNTINHQLVSGTYVLQLNTTDSSVTRKILVD